MSAEHLYSGRDLWLKGPKALLALGFIVATASIGLATLSGCGTGGTATPASALGVLEVRGFVEEVRANSLTSIEFFSVRDDAGTLWEFTAERPLELSPSHMREHRALGLAVSVQYREAPEGLVAVELAD